jgi:rubrerythrin
MLSNFFENAVTSMQLDQLEILHQLQDGFTPKKTSTPLVAIFEAMQSPFLQFVYDVVDIGRERTNWEFYDGQASLAIRVGPILRFNSVV